MFKDNGRLEPAKKEELANLKGKPMLCPNCGKQFIMVEVSFADTKCTECGAILIENGQTAAGKTTGK